MNRRTILTTAAVGSALPLVAQNYSDYTKDPRPDVAGGSWSAGAPDGPVFKGSPVVSGLGEARQRHEPFLNLTMRTRRD